MKGRGIALAAVAGLLMVGCSSGRGNPFFIRLSGPMPAISGTTLAGRPFGSADYRGKVVVVNFWNYDCPPCRQEQPLLQSSWNALATKGVSMVGVMFVGGFPPWPDDRTAARAYLERFGVTYPAIVDEGSAIARRFGIPGIPTTVIVDRTGQMRFRILGRVRPGQLDQLIDELG
ncbi:MAG: TlpA family protein disulfide reductase [Actinobacteria bacterium]|nr:MAG: TlpA family protein disulfide reductase [Actinomycetota bacterium]